MRYESRSAWRPRMDTKAVHSVVSGLHADALDELHRRDLSLVDVVHGDKQRES